MYHKPNIQFMKAKLRQSPNAALKVKLKNRLIVAAISFALISVAGVLIFLYLNIGVTETAKAAPTNISGVINSYMRVTNFNSSLRTFTTDNLSGSASDFAVGKTILVYQAKGANIQTSNNSTYGTVSAYNNSGRYEFATVSGYVNGGGGVYTIKVSSLINSYTGTGAMQLVSVPTYTDATVTGNITATPWSTSLGRGGVVTFQVASDLTLGANINVSGQGFLGGAPAGSNGDCPDNTTYRSNSNNFGAKGEGISTDGYLYAIGPQANGGGGGNPHNAGGGAGGNLTYGGDGGRGYQPGGGCSNVSGGGKGGLKINYASLADRVFFGGGGGAGQQNNGLASAGGAGGGIIIIRAKNVKSTCGGTYGFIANGQSATDSGGNDGAGGGGAGGAIVLDVTNYVLTCNILVQVNGGSGGSVGDPAVHGGGGGGGVGAIIEIRPTSNARVSKQNSIGTNGKDCTTCTTSSGSPAETPTTTSMSASAIPGTLIALPITLLNFTGTVEEKGVRLNWSTAQEENNDYFTIERSTDGTTFEVATTVPGAGNSNQELHYTALDEDVRTAAVYYRLKQTDYNGVFTYSKVIYVDTRELKRSEISIYPNPASSVVNVVNTSEEPMYIRIMNDKGRVLFEQETSERETAIDVSSIDAGIYILETSSPAGSNKKAQRLVIRH